MNAAELRALAERLLAVEPHDYEDRPALESAAEVLELLAWAEENEIEVHPVGGYWDITVFNAGYADKTLISTLRRAREAERG